MENSLVKEAHLAASSNLISSGLSCVFLLPRLSSSPLPLKPWETGCSNWRNNSGWGEAGSLSLSPSLASPDRGDPREMLWDAESAGPQPSPLTPACVMPMGRLH